jgi:Fe-S cluster biogenesis protein NfuA/nitrite reductase/ring-hydroxylating ferredoxin subunit
LSDDDVAAVGARIEALVEELGALPDPIVRARSEELVRALLDFYGAGLRRILELASAGGNGSGGLLSKLADDPLVSSLLLVHSLHPVDTETRIVQALDQVRPYLASHGGDVTFLGLREGVAQLRLEGSCHGCDSSLVTMKLALERAVEEAAPEVLGLNVEGVREPERPSPLIQIQSRTGAPSPAAPTRAAWVTLDAGLEFGAAPLAPLDLRGQSVVVCRAGGALYAYRDRCPACGSPLAGSSLRDAVLACASCDKRFDVRRAGRPLDGGGPLEPLPLLEQGDRVQIAVAAAP